MMRKDSRIFVTGHSGLVGSAVVRRLRTDGYKCILTVNRDECDLRKSLDVQWIMSSFNPDYVINCAGLVGGINANNTRSGEFIYDNLMIQTNIIEACRVYKVKKLMILGSSCIYPRDCPSPIKEEYLMTGLLEETNVAYSVAKMAGLTMCRMYRKQYGCNFISILPTNLYGIGDSFTLLDSHVIPGMMRKLHDAKATHKEIVTFWGSGKPLREFMFADDLADAIIFFMNNYDGDIPINIGTGDVVSIADLAEMLQDIVGYTEKIFWDGRYPDGTPHKTLDLSKIHALGWRAKTPLIEGLTITYHWFSENYPNARL